MTGPFFYLENLIPENGVIQFDEVSSHHAVIVLRMKKGAPLVITDGKGNAFEAILENDHKKKAQARIQNSTFTPPQIPKTAIAISLLKNTNRLEWFLEKAMELGIGRIQPLICERTERTHFRYDRMKGVLVSALLQSRQVWLPLLEEPLPAEQLSESALNEYHLFVAHCEEGEKKPLNLACREAPKQNKMVFIGPEGDFTREEIILLEKLGATPVSLGSTRLRTETAGVAAAVMLVQPV